MRKLLLIAAILPVLLAQRSSRNLMLGMTDAPATPTDSPGAGTYGSTQSVTLADATAQFILYTIDGSTPACPATGTLYTGAISVASTTTIKAIGCNGVTGGGVLTSVYTISAANNPALVGSPSTCTNIASGSPCTITTTASGHLLVVAIQGAVGSTVSAVADSATDTFTAVRSPSTAYVNQAGAAFADVWYTPSTGGAVTTVTATTSAGNWYAVVWEVSGMSTVTVDQVGILSGQTGADPLGPSLTTTAAKEFMVSTTVVTVNGGSIKAGNECTTAATILGDGWAHLITTASGAHQCQWNVTSQTYGSNGVAFK